MADVRLSIAGREYLVTCRDGEEQRLEALGALVHEKAEEAGGAAQGLNESRQLLFASLLLADQLADSTGAGAASTPPEDQINQRNMAGAAADNDLSAKDLDTLEKLADRIEAAADRLEQ